MADVLQTIVAATRRIVAVRRERESDAALERRAFARQPAGERFRAALDRRDRLNVIAECKRRSPSRGVLRCHYDPAALAMSYARAGAAAISVLTEPTFFDGAIAHLGRVRDAVDLPLLRKDFVIDSYQLLEARAHGADAVLLIVAVLAGRDLRTLVNIARLLDLAALVEVHDIPELERALEAGAEIVGVNNRNLRTLEVDTRVSELAAVRIPPSVIAVSESGLRTADDLLRLSACGYRAFLVGERFMADEDPGAALHDLLARAGQALRVPDVPARISDPS